MKSASLENVRSRASGYNIITLGYIRSVLLGRDTKGNWLCPFPNCGEACEDGENHLNTAHRVPEFKCHVCQTIFSGKVGLKIHAMKKHNIKEVIAKAVTAFSTF